MFTEFNEIRSVNYPSFYKLYIKVINPEWLIFDTDVHIVAYY